MRTLAVGLAAVLGAASLAEAQLPLQQAVTLGDDKSEGGAAATHPSGDSAASHKPSKAELAKAALSKAEARHKDAVEQADHAMKQLTDYADGLYHGTDPKTVAEAIERGAANMVQSDVQDAEKAFSGHLSALGHASTGASFAGLEDEALKAAKDVRHAQERKAREMRHIMSQMQKDKKAKAHDLSREAQHAATAALKAARALETAQRHAEVKGRDFEGAYDRAEDAFEHMRDHAEDVGDKAEDKVERFFDHVESEIDARSDRVVDEADHNSRDLHRKVSHARQQAEAEARREAQAARAAKRASSGADAEHAKEPEASDKASNMEHSGSDDHAASDKSGDAASKPDADVTLASEDARAARTSAIVLCGVAGLFAGIGLAASVQRRRSIREPALLG